MSGAAPLRPAAQAHRHPHLATPHPPAPTPRCRCGRRRRCPIAEPTQVPEQEDAGQRGGLARGRDLRDHRRQLERLPEPSLAGAPYLAPYLIPILAPI